MQKDKEHKISICANSCYAYEGVSVPCDGVCNWVIYSSHKNAPGAHNVELILPIK